MSCILAISATTHRGGAAMTASAPSGCSSRIIVRGIRGQELLTPPSRLSNNQGD